MFLCPLEWCCLMDFVSSVVQAVYQSLRKLLIHQLAMRDLQWQSWLNIYSLSQSWLKWWWCKAWTYKLQTLIQSPQNQWEVQSMSTSFDPSNGFTFDPLLKKYEDLFTFELSSCDNVQKVHMEVWYTEHYLHRNFILSLKSKRLLFHQNIQ